MATSLLEYISVCGLFFGVFVVWLTNERHLKQNIYIKKQEIAFYCLNKFSGKLEKIATSDYEDRANLFQMLSSEKKVLINAIKECNKKNTKDDNIDLMPLLRAIQQEQDSNLPLNYVYNEVGNLQSRTFIYFFKCIA